MTEKILLDMRLGKPTKHFQDKGERKMIKFLKNFGVYFLELAFLIMLFGFAWFLLVAFG
jgi:hypothetical protein